MDISGDLIYAYNLINIEKMYKDDILRKKDNKRHIDIQLEVSSQYLII